MPNNDIVKTNGDVSNLPVRREETPVPSLYRDMVQWMDSWDRRFNDIFKRSFDFAPSTFSRWNSFSPAVNVTETDKAFTVTAELPGMDEQDINLMLERDALLITGEKKNEVEHKDKGYYRMERTYGAFRREIPLPGQIDPEHVEATFKKGVLTVTLPKIGPDKPGTTKIEIRTE